MYNTYDVLEQVLFNRRESTKVDHLPITCEWVIANYRRSFPITDYSSLLIVMCCQLYETSQCFKILKVMSVSHNKIFSDKILSWSSFTKLPLGKTFYHVSLLKSINSGDVAPPSPGESGGTGTSQLVIILNRLTWLNFKFRGIFIEPNKLSRFVKKIVRSNTYITFKS